MGIPFYVRYLSRKYDGIINMTWTSSSKVHQLHVDFNGIVHMTARSVQQQQPPRSVPELERDICAAAIKHLRYVIDSVSPDTVFVAVDGVPPRSKMQQQRERRYMKSWNESSGWDTNAISPGTKFMDMLCRELDAFSERTTDVRVDVSGSETPGEGEQKILDRIRANHGADQCIVVYGLDADLFLMTAASPSPSIYVMREMELCGLVQFADISRLRTAIHHECDSSGDVTRRVYDYVAMCSLMGNDFLPSIPQLSIRDGAPNVLVSIYKDVVVRPSASVYLVNEDGLIDKDLAARIFDRLSHMEDAMMQARDDKYYEMSRRLPPNSQTDQYPLAFPMPNVIRPHDVRGWRLRYYHHLIGNCDVSLVNAMCASYVTGIQWSTLYMLRGVEFKTGWYYPYSYAPTALDVRNSLMSSRHAAICDDGECELQGDEEIDSVRATWWQLITILPPTSAKLIPSDALLELVRHPSVMHMFPKTFRLTVYLNEHTWQCKPILPHVDVGRLKQTLKAELSGRR